MRVLLGRDILVLIFYLALDAVYYHQILSNRWALALAFFTRHNISITPEEIIEVPSSRSSPRYCNAC
jgi:hypothetical protein